MTPAVFAAPALVQNWLPVVDVLPASRQNQDSEVVQPWRRECRPSRGLLATCWSHSGNARTSHFTVADSTATHRQFWRSHSPQNSLHLRLSGGSSTNTRSPPNSIPRGRPSLWPLLVTMGERFSYSMTPVLNPWIVFLGGPTGNRMR